MKYVKVLASALLAGLAVGQLAAQQAPSDGVTVTKLGDRLNVVLTFKQRDVRVALKELFQAGHKSFQIDSGVQGSVTVSLKNVDFDTAVLNVARQCNGVFKVEKGTYYVKYKAPAVEPPKPYTWADVAEMERQARLPVNVSVDYENTDVRDVIRDIFRQAKKSFTIAPDVQANVTVALKNVEFQSALKIILGAADAEYKLDGGCYNIIVKGTIPYGVPMCRLTIRPG